jgi:hypothetical protein
MLGKLVVLPLPGGSDVGVVAVGPALVLALVVAGLLSLGGLSLELARRRAALVAELRFSATVQDLRTVVLLRRQLAGETPRNRPWWKLRASLFRNYPVWRRAWQSYLRWPGERVVRAVMVGVAAGLLAAATWAGTTPLAAVAGLVLFVAGLDAVEPLAQEFDHPTRRDLLPLSPATLAGRHLASSVGMTTLVSLVAVLVTIPLGAPGVAAEIGVVMIVPTAILIACCAALSASNDPYAHLFAPELALAQSLAPAVLAIVGVGLPLLLAREAVRHGHSPIGATVITEIVVLLACAVSVVILNGRARGKEEEMGLE